VNARVLIVDDDRDMCEFVASGIGRRGFEPTWCLSADEAIALLGTRPFGAVVADLNMPGASGIDLCGEIAARQPDIPVLVVTAFGSLDTAVAGTPRSARRCAACAAR
jgi:DNA-binding NtrC family response regulator